MRASKVKVRHNLFFLSSSQELDCKALDGTVDQGSQTATLSPINPFSAKPPTGPAAQTNSSPFGTAHQRAQQYWREHTAERNAHNMEGRTTCSHRREARQARIQRTGCQQTGRTRYRTNIETPEKLNAMTGALAEVYEDPAMDQTFFSKAQRIGLLWFDLWRLLKQSRIQILLERTAISHLSAVHLQCLTDSRKP